MCDLGERLKAARLAKGLSLEEASRRLALKKGVLAALEECRFDLLPEPALAKGYLKRYALLLGLEPESLLALYPKPSFQPPPPPKKPFPWGVLLGVGTGLLVLLGLVLWLSRPSPPRVVELPPPAPKPPKQHTLEISTEPPGAQAYLDGFYLGQTPLKTPPLEGGKRLLRLEAPGYEAVEEEILLDKDLALRYAMRPLPEVLSKPEAPLPSDKLRLRLAGRSWLRVTTPDGERLYEGIPEVGAILEFPLPVEVRAGNPPAVWVLLGEKEEQMGSEARPLTRRFP
ncbi:MAG: RodZ domain-containing protein [Thermaceae bacterium]